MSGLTKKQRAFIEHYLICWNATEAARRAGYAYPNKRGPENVVKRGIADEIERRIAELTMTANEVLVRLAEQARGIDSQYFLTGPDGGIALDFEALIRDGKGHLIKSLSYSKDGELTRVEFYDAQAALAHIGRSLRLFVDRVEHSGTMGGAIPHDLTRVPAHLLRAVTDAMTAGEPGEDLAPSPA